MSLQTADSHAVRGDYDMAIRLYASAVAKNVKGARERHCHALDLADRHTEALACCAAAIQLQSSSAFMYQLDGQVALTAGLAERSASSYGRAMRLSPADGDLALNLGIALIAAGQHREAIYRLRRSLELSPAGAAVGYAELGRAIEAHGNELLAAQRPAEAAVTWESALRLPSRPAGASSVAYFGLGRASLALGDACAARQSFASATSLAPADADSWHQRGVAARRCGTRGGTARRRRGDSTKPGGDEARRAFLRAVAIEPTRSDSLSLLLLRPLARKADGAADATLDAPESAEPIVSVAVDAQSGGVAAPTAAHEEESAHAEDRQVAAAGGGAASSAEDLMLPAPPEIAAESASDYGEDASSSSAASSSSLSSSVTAAAAAAATEAWENRAVAMLSTHGALMVPRVLPDDVATALAAHIAPSGGQGGGETPYDTTNTTLSRTARRHVAVSLRAPEVQAALARLAKVLRPALCRALSRADGSDHAHSHGREVEAEAEAEAEAAEETAAEATAAAGVATACSLKLIEGGILTSWPGAAAQPIHTDTAQQPDEARAFKIQFAASAIGRAMGPIEVVPGSSGAPPTTAASDAAKPLPLPLPVGSVLVYDTRTWHRGGANRSRRPRPVFYVTVINEAGGRLPPAGLPYTIEPTEAGCFELGSLGVVLNPTRSAAKRAGSCE